MLVLCIYFLVKSHNSPMMYAFLVSQFFRWLDWGTERLNNLTKIHSNWQSRDLNNDNLTSEPVLLSTHQGKWIKYILWANCHVQCWSFIDKAPVRKQHRVWWRSQVRKPHSYLLLPSSPLLFFGPFAFFCHDFILWTCILTDLPWQILELVG